MRRAAACAMALVGLGGCDGASPDPGLDALLQVDGAQFRPGPFPADEGGPAAVMVAARRAELVVGHTGGSLHGAVAPAARVAVLGLDGVDGTWLVPAGVPDLETPDLASVRATFAVADDFPPGPFTLSLAAAGADGRFGAPATTMIVADAEEPPAGELVVALAWDGDADLDLHVVDPLGGEAWNDQPNTWQPPPPGEPVDPLAYLTGGILDHDANKDCVREGRPREVVSWSMPPPAGGYTVRVDTRSMCGAASAGWYVAAYRGGEAIAAARGRSTAGDVLHDHGRGAGVLALQFTVPSAQGRTPP